MKILTSSIAVLLSLSLLTGCDRLRLPGAKPNTYSTCIGDHLRDVHTKEAVSVVVAACSTNFPQTNDLWRLQRQLPALNINGKASVDTTDGIASRFSGTLYNPSTDLIVTEIVLVLSYKAKEPEKKPATQAWRAPLSYRVPILIWPQTTTAFSTSILPDDGYGESWSISEVLGVEIAAAK